MRLFGTAARVLLLSALITPAAGAQVYSNGPNGVNGWNHSAEAYLDFGWQGWDDFTLGSATTLTRVSFWAVDFSASAPLSSSINWEIFDDVAGTRGALRFSGLGAVSSSIVGSGCCGTTRYLSDFLFSVALGSGTYWLGLYNSTGPDFWETANQLGSPAEWTYEGFNDVGFAFELYDESVVPEPATVILLGTGLLSLGLVHHRRKKSRQDPT